MSGPPIAPGSPGRPTGWRENFETTLKGVTRMAIKKYKKGLRSPFIGVVVGTLGLAGILLTFSTPCQATAAKPAPAAIPKVVNLEATLANKTESCPPNATCSLIPAIPSTMTNSNPSSSSVTHITERLTIREKLVHFQRVRGVVVGVYQQPNGLKSRKGCVDPIASGWIARGGAFRNTRANGGPFWTHWKPGWQICDAKQIRIGKNLFWRGTKLNCGNREILIPIRISFRPKLVKVIEVRSLYEFVKIYDKWIKKNSSTTTTATTTTTYSCPTGWTLVNVNQCMLVTTTPTTTVTTTTPTTTGTTTPPTPRNNTCSFSAESSKSDPTVANGVAIVSSGGNVSWSWGDGSSSSGTSVSHKYATPSPGPASSGVTYTISVSASFPSGSSPINCGSRTFFVPAPPPSATASSTSTTTSSTTSTTTTGGSPPLP